MYHSTLFGRPGAQHLGQSLAGPNDGRTAVRIPQVNRGRGVKPLENPGPNQPHDSPAHSVHNEMAELGGRDQDISILEEDGIDVAPEARTPPCQNLPPAPAPDRHFRQGWAHTACGDPEWRAFPALAEGVEATMMRSKGCRYMLWQRARLADVNPVPATELDVQTQSLSVAFRKIRRQAA